MSSNGNLDIERHGIDGEALYCKLAAIIEAYSLMVNVDSVGSFQDYVMVGLDHFRYQTLDELEQYVFGKKEPSKKDGE